MMAKEIKVEIPAWVLIELIHKPQGELFKYNSEAPAPAPGH